MSILKNSITSICAAGAIGAIAAPKIDAQPKTGAALLSAPATAACAAVAGRRREIATGLGLSAADGVIVNTVLADEGADMKKTLLVGAGAGLLAGGFAIRLGMATGPADNAQYNHDATKGFVERKFLQGEQLDKSQERKDHDQGNSRS